MKTKSEKSNIQKLKNYYRTTPYPPKTSKLSSKYGQLFHGNYFQKILIDFFYFGQVLYRLHNHKNSIHGIHVRSK